MEPIKPRKHMNDLLSCGLGTFACKFPSLLQFANVMRNQEEDARALNLRSLRMTRCHFARGNGLTGSILGLLQTVLAQLQRSP